VSAKQLFEQGRVRDAQQALSEWLRGHPEDTVQRTFLFELLCFSGDWERAERQLDVLRSAAGPRELGGILYFSAVYAERTRHATFAGAARPEMPATKNLCGALNGRQFRSITDADSAIVARLEIFAAGSYLLLAFEHIESIRMAAPTKLRDTLWIPARVRTTTSLHGGELGEVLIPAVYPFSWKEPQEAVWLGRETRWLEEGQAARPVGQKILVVDSEDVPILEVRELEFAKTGAVRHA
jgi:type VI secretion system protein ImpE